VGFEGEMEDGRLEGEGREFGCLFEGNEGWVGLNVVHHAIVAYSISLMNTK
jgi:hypothetical protein